MPLHAFEHLFVLMGIYLAQGYTYTTGVRWLSDRIAQILQAVGVSFFVINFISTW